ncbi:hypothetical protein [Rugamonas rubra]|uniref:Peptidase propeptide and YPEB domain-containing protein n=1 Tax=Rugamonas rubra TaxID=758825 RepID=A0A1I4SHF4_9BURK|nr:hypothetical protein [Rugamonas rubra]SFM63733.1 hypothetical protein SAMN02982985_04771 [Rugamonas rubra]
MKTRLILAALIAAPLAAADPLTDMEIQRDVVEYRLSQGESRAEVCEVAERYFDVRCQDTGSEFILQRGENLDITYMVTISTKDAP